MAAGKTYEPIATTTLGSATNTITFSSIPSTYTDLKIVLLGSANENIGMRFNNNTGTNYSYTSLSGDGSAAESTNGANLSILYLTPGVGWSSAYPGLIQVDVFSYTNSTYKTVLINRTQDYNSAGRAQNIVSLWRNTSAITTITIFTTDPLVNMNVGTTATLYGIKAA